MMKMYSYKDGRPIRITLDSCIKEGEPLQYNQIVYPKGSLEIVKNQLMPILNQYGYLLVMTEEGLDTYYQTGVYTKIEDHGCAKAKEIRIEGNCAKIVIEPVDNQHSLDLFDDIFEYKQEFEIKFMISAKTELGYNNQSVIVLNTIETQPILIVVKKS